MKKNKSPQLQLLESNPYLWCHFFYEEHFVLPREYEPILDRVDKGWSLIWEWYRSCAKTACIRKMIVKFIVTRRKQFIRWTSYDMEKSTDNISSISNMLIAWPDHPLIKNYGSLYGAEADVDKEFKQKTQERITGFTTKNNVIVKGNAIKKSARWQSMYLWNSTIRPDLDIFDDVDDNENTKKRERIDKTYESLMSGVRWWSTWQMILLGNCIRRDGVLPRLIENHKNDPNFMIVKMPIYKGNVIARPERFVWTDKEAEQKNSGVLLEDEKVQSIETLSRQSFWNNEFLLNPISDADKIIKESWIQYRWGTTGVSLLQDHRSRTYVAVDPAYSKNTESDPMGISVVTLHPWNNGQLLFFFHKVTELVWEDKSKKNAWNFIKRLYDRYNVSLVIIESNNWWETIADECRDHGCACVTVASTKDKTTRLREKETLFSSWYVYFKVDECDVWVRQLIDYPDTPHDDMMDSIVLWLSATNYHNDLQETKKIYEQAKNNQSWKNSWSSLSSKYSIF